MADNVGYTEGSGKTIAADDVGGVLYQRIKPVVGADGTAVDVSESNPMPMAAYGELIEAVEALRMAVSTVARNMSIPDANGQIRASVGSVATVGTVSSVSTCSTVSSVTTVSNVSQLNGFPATAVLFPITFGSFHQLRSNISVT
jgi:hypothetical protein